MPGRTRFRRAGLDRATLANPFLPAAVEHCRVVEAKHAQQPPHPRRPPRIGGAVEHDPRSVADTKAAHRRGKGLSRRQHEAQPLAAVRKVGLKVDELRAGNMTLFEISPRRHRLIGRLRVGYQIGRAVEDTQIGIAQLATERFSIDQKFRMDKTGIGHNDLLSAVTAGVPRSPGAGGESRSPAQRRGRRA